MMTKQEAITKHRNMWNWIADQYKNGTVHTIPVLKGIYVREHENNEILYNCYCCEYTKTKGKIAKFDCHYCPLKWPSEYRMVACTYSGSCRDGLYALAVKASLKLNDRKTERLCRRIAQLPEQK